MIYFIQRTSDNAIKIGKALDIQDRFHSLKRKYKNDKLEPLAKLEGYTKEERELHARFAPLCVEGEWFRPESALFDFISNHTQPFYHSMYRPKLVKCQAQVNGRQCTNWARKGDYLCGAHNKPRFRIRE